MSIFGPLSHRPLHRASARASRPWARGLFRRTHLNRSTQRISLTRRRAGAVRPAGLGPRPSRSRRRCVIWPWIAHGWGSLD